MLRLWNFRSLVCSCIQLSPFPFRVPVTHRGLINEVSLSFPLYNLVQTYNLLSTVPLLHTQPNRQAWQKTAFSLVLIDWGEDETCFFSWELRWASVAVVAKIPVQTRYTTFICSAFTGTEHKKRGKKYSDSILVNGPAASVCCSSRDR